MAELGVTLLCVVGVGTWVGASCWIFRDELRRWMGTQTSPTQPIDELVIQPASHEPTATHTQFIPQAELMAAANRRLDHHAWSAQPLPSASMGVPVLRVHAKTEEIPSARVHAAHVALAHPVAREPTPTPEPIPTFEPKHVPEPSAPTPVATGLTIDELEPQLEAAERAFVEWQRARDALSLQALADGPERALLDALTIVATASDSSCSESLEPALLQAETPDERRQVIALALLSRDESHAHRLIDRALDRAELAASLREVLLSFRTDESDWRLHAQARQSDQHREFWLELLDARRIDPGPELLAELLAGSDEQRTWALRLARFHADAERRRQLAQSHQHDMRHPAQRMAAVELAVLDDQPAAWLQCRQMANMPAFPRATELVATLGSARELDPLARRLDGASGQALLRLCRSGRKRAATLAAQRLTAEPGDTLAASALRYVIGDPPTTGDDETATLLEHWTACAAQLDDERRHLFGVPFGSGDSLRRALTSIDVHHRHAIADELFLRSRGRIRWPGRGFARAMLTGLDTLATSTIDFEDPP